MDERLERVWARWCARRVLHLWEAPEVVARWIDTGDEALREEAVALAWEDGSGAAAWAAAWAAEQPVEAEESAMWAAREAMWEAFEAGWSTERAAQRRARALIEALSALLPAHGLSALRLDEALEDRWLTREVWRVVMEREVEVEVLQDDGITYRTEIVRVVADWEVVCDWAGERATPCRSQEVAP